MCESLKDLIVAIIVTILFFAAFTAGGFSYSMHIEERILEQGHYKLITGAKVTFVNNKKNNE